MVITAAYCMCGTNYKKLTFSLKRTIEGTGFPCTRVVRQNERPFSLFMVLIIFISSVMRMPPTMTRVFHRARVHRRPG